MATIYTVGHSNKSIEEFAALLSIAEVGTLVDVRTRPFSKWNPQFNEGPMRAALVTAGFQYEGRGKNLGGLGRNVNYAETIAELAERAEAGEKIAVCCSEGDYHKCHRYDMLTPSFERAGLDVVHILWTGELKMNSAPAKVAPPDTQLTFDFSADLPTRQTVRAPRGGGFVRP